jgi:hypothetical protein
MLGIPTAIVMLLPRRVMVTPMELRQKSWSRGETRIASADVVSTHEDPDGNVTVYAKDGSQILFSAYLVSQPQFMQDLARYAPIQPTAVN